MNKNINKLILKVVEMRRYANVIRLVDSINRRYGYERVRGVSVNSVYFVGGSDILIEFQDVEKVLSIVCDRVGTVLSCKLNIGGMEAEGLTRGCTFGSTRNSVVLG